MLSQKVSTGLSFGIWEQKSSAKLSPISSGPNSGKPKTNLRKLQISLFFSWYSLFKLNS